MFLLLLGVCQAQTRKTRAPQTAAVPSDLAFRIAQAPGSEEETKRKEAALIKEKIKGGSEASKDAGSQTFTFEERTFMERQTAIEEIVQKKILSFETENGPLSGEKREQFIQDLRERFENEFNQ